MDLCLLVITCFYCDARAFIDECYIAPEDGILTCVSCRFKPDHATLAMAEFEIALEGDDFDTDGCQCPDCLDEDCTADDEGRPVDLAALQEG